MIYLNETLLKTLNVFKYYKTIENYIIKKRENTYFHKGSINNNIETYMTPTIITKINNSELDGNSNKELITNLVKNNEFSLFSAALTLNFGEKYLETKKAFLNKKNINIIINNLKNESLKDYIINNKNNLDNELYEVLMEINFFWEQNAEKIKSLNFEDKLKLCEFLNINKNLNSREISFHIIKNNLENLSFDNNI